MVLAGGERQALFKHRDVSFLPRRAILVTAVLAIGVTAACGAGGGSGTTTKTDSGRDLAGIDGVVDSTVNSTGGDASVDGSTVFPDGGVENNACALVGCADTPLCSTGCRAPCGCCACTEGMFVSSDGGTLRCTGGCLFTVMEMTDAAPQGNDATGNGGALGTGGAGGTGATGGTGIDAFGQRGVFESVCPEDLTAPMTRIAQALANAIHP